jgi:predicted dehydrogenase
MTAKVKLAFLGCGDVAQRDYLPEMHRLADRAEIVAVCGRGEARAREAAAHFGVPASYTDYRRMLAETDAAAVINLTPIQLHAETTLAALEAGKHVYSEKPAAGTVAEANRIREEARRRGLTVVCAPSVTLFPQLVAARDLLNDDAIGPVHAAVGQGHGGVPPWSGYRSDPSPFFARGGGPLADMGVYPLHAITGLLGPARRVNAMAAQVQTGFVVPDGPAAGKEVPIEVPDNWLVQVDLGESRLASVTANNVAQASRGAQLELFGLRGTLAINLLDVAAPLELYRPESGWEQIPVPHARAGGPDHLLGVAHLVDCITRGTEPVIGIDHATHVLDILEGAVQSATSGRTVTLAPRTVTFAAIDPSQG